MKKTMRRSRSSWFIMNMSPRWWLKVLLIQWSPLNMPSVDIRIRLLRQNRQARLNISLMCLETPLLCQARRLICPPEKCISRGKSCIFTHHMEDTLLVDVSKAPEKCDWYRFRWSQWMEGTEHSESHNPTRYWKCKPWSKLLKTGLHKFYLSTLLDF